MAGELEIGRHRFILGARTASARCIVATGKKSAAPEQAAFGQLGSRCACRRPAQAPGWRHTPEASLSPLSAGMVGALDAHHPPSHAGRRNGESALCVAPSAAAVTHAFIAPVAAILLYLSTRACRSASDASSLSLRCCHARAHPPLATATPQAPKTKKQEPEETLTRIAIVNEDRCGRVGLLCGRLQPSHTRIQARNVHSRSDQTADTSATAAAHGRRLGHRCKPKKCRQECKKSCPVRVALISSVIGMHAVVEAARMTHDDCYACPAAVTLPEPHRTTKNLHTSLAISNLKCAGCQSRCVLVVALVAARMHSSAASLACMAHAAVAALPLQWLHWARTHEQAIAGTCSALGMLMQTRREASATLALLQQLLHSSHGR